MTAPVMDRTALQAALNDSDPFKAMLAAQMAAEVELNPNDPIYITIHDKFWKPTGECYNYISTEFGFPRSAADTMTLKLDGNDPLADLVLTCDTTFVPITAEVGYLRWAGWVDIALDKFDGKTYTVECSCISLYAMLSRVVAWPAPELPIQVQFPNHGVDFGGAVTVLQRFMESQFLRLQSGIWELVNNLGSLNLDWRSWFGTWLASNGDIIDMLRTPFVVVRDNPLTDTSPFVSINWRMDKLDTLIQQTVKDNGLVVEVNLWKEGDAQPPNLLLPLDIPTYVVTVKDRSGRTGPTGTALDGFLLDFLDLEDSSSGEVLKPFLNPGNEYAPDGVAIAPVLGVNFVPPWVIFTDHPRGGLTEFEFAHHAPLAWQIVSGGKSPKWAGALRFNRRGAPAHCAMNERSDQRDARVLHRRDNDRDRLHGRALGRARWDVRRHTAGLPTGGELRPADSTRSVRADGDVLPDRQRGVHARCVLRSDQSHVGHPRLRQRQGVVQRRVSVPAR
jgi:hypothetical protein